MKVLYLSYDGMTDPLGQSQVIPYLQGLAAAKHEIWLISFEKPERYTQHRERIHTLLSQSNIHWHPLPYTAKPPVLSTLLDLWKMQRSAKRLIEQHQIQLIHCRSYISALVGLAMKRKTGTRFLFDMRGFWADERIDGNIWKLSNPIFRTIYRFFKRKEKEFLLEADAVVSLTHNAAHEIHSWPGMHHVPITVIPCCADLDHYRSGEAQKQRWVEQLNISPNNFVLSYLGSLGTWYMLPEMLDFFRELLKIKPEALFLIITPDKPEHIRSQALKADIPTDSLRIISAQRNDVPAIAALSHLSIFFIKPSYSKKASSPTKMGELMAAGIPLVVNAGVGDVDRILADGGNGLVIEEFSTQHYQKALEKLDTVLQADRSRNSQCAERWYSLQEGVKRYRTIYQQLEEKS